MSCAIADTTGATNWRDIRNRRNHKLITRELEKRIPPLGDSDKVASVDDMLVHVKLFSPYSVWSWYIVELDLETGRCFGLVEGFETEMGYFDLADLANATCGELAAVERDLHWRPTTIGKIRRSDS